MRLWTLRETRHLLLLSVTLVVVAAVTLLVGDRLFPSWVPGLSILVVTLAGLVWLGGLGLSIRRQLVGWLEYERFQQQALHAIHSILPIRAPLAPMTSWAATPGFIATVLEHLQRARRKRGSDLTVVECGSGVSTVVTAYALEMMGSGRVISLDHDDAYGKVTSERLLDHGLQAFGQVIHAPLKDVTIQGDGFPWYDLDQLTLEGTIDLLVVDGPPESTRSWARYPAFPLLVDRLSDEAWILVDDAGRPDERASVESWVRESGGQLTARFVDSGKGMAVCHFRRTSS